MGSPGRPSASRFLGKRTLIVGDVGSGKTRYTAEILSYLLLSREGVTVIDMGPERRGIGLPLTRYVDIPNWVRYLRPKSLRAPRLEGKNADEVLRLAKHNLEVIRPFLLIYQEEPTSILVMNDLSIYLQAGPLEDILNCIRESSTFLGNAYYGSNLAEDKGSGISYRERVLVEELMRGMDYVILLVRYLEDGPPQ